MSHHAGITLHYHGVGKRRYGHTHAFLSIMHEHDEPVGAPPSDTTPTGAPAEPTNDPIGAETTLSP